MRDGNPNPAQQEPTDRKDSRAMQRTDTTHHRPITNAVAAVSPLREHKFATFTRTLAQRIAAQLGTTAAYMSFQEFAPDAPAELRGWRRHQIGIAGRTVVIIGTPEPYLPTMPRYRVEVDGAEVPYRFTWDRPLIELLADAAAAHIAAQRTADRAA